MKDMSEEFEQKLLNALSSIGNDLKSLLDVICGSTSVYSAKQPPCPYTLHSWLDTWYKVYKLPYIKPNYAEAIEVSIRVHIKRGLPDIALNELQPVPLQEFYNGITASRTRKSAYDVLNMALKHAVKLDLITKNPMEGVQIPAHRREPGEPLSPAELKRFLSKIKGRPLENYFLFLLYTGCRRNEGLGLKVSDIDFKNSLVHIRGTKTEASKRTIPLFEKIGGRMVGVLPDKNGFYFPYSSDYVTHKFKEYCPAHKLHDLRHTFGTTCLSAKIPDKVIQKWLGHSDIQTTLNIYTHVTDEIHKSEATTLNRFLTEKKPRK
jgi:integrase